MAKLLHQICFCFFVLLDFHNRMVKEKVEEKDNIEHFLECHVRWFIPFFSLDSERYLIKYWQFRKTRPSLCKKYFLELSSVLLYKFSSQRPKWQTEAIYSSTHCTVVGYSTMTAFLIPSSPRYLFNMSVQSKIICRFRILCQKSHIWYLWVRK